MGKFNEAGEIFLTAAHQRLNRIKGKNLYDVAGLYAQAANAFRLSGNKEKALLYARESLRIFPGHPKGNVELFRAEQMI
jgi:hypothetical protein